MLRCFDISVLRYFDISSLFRCICTQGGFGSGLVLLQLRFQGLDAVEALLVAQPLDERYQKALAIQVVVQLEDMRL